MRKIDAIEEAVREAKAPPSVPLLPTESEIEEARFARYLKLRKPITCGQVTLDRLLLDPSELSGDTFFILDARFRNEHSFVYATSVNKTGESIFLSMILAELNGITVEDLRKVSFMELDRALRRVQNFLYRESV